MGRLTRRVFGWDGLAALLTKGVTACIFPLPILRVVARKVFHLSIALKHQKMVDDFIHEVTVVTHDNDTTMERLKVFFEHLQGNNV